MNCEKNERMRDIVRAAMEGDCARLAAEYDAIDASAVRLRPRLDVLVYRAIRRERAGHARQPAAAPSLRRTLLYVAIAVLLAAIMSVSIAASRGGGMWNAVVEWYEGYIKLHFVQTPEQPDPEGDVEALAPTYLQRTYLPTCAYGNNVQFRYDDIDVNRYRMISYEFYRGGVTLCYFKQLTLDQPVYPADIDRYERDRTTINGAFAEYFTHPDTGTCSLLFTDGEYWFLLQSDVLSREELMQWAKSLAPAESIFGQERQKVNQPTYLPGELVERVVYTDPYCRHIAYYLGNDRVLEFRQNPFDAQDGIRRYMSAEYDEGTRFAYVTVGNYIAQIQKTPLGTTLLYWSDGEYRYTLSSPLYTTQTLVEIAESVRCVSAGPNRLELIYIPKIPDEDLEVEVESYTSTRYEQRYYRDHVRVCTYVQQIMSEELPVGSGAYTEQALQIHYREATLRTYEGGERILVWSDGSYRYVLRSSALSVAQLLSWAKSVCPPTTLQTLCRPQTDGLAGTTVASSEIAVSERYRDGVGNAFSFAQTVLWSDASSYDPACEMSDVYVNDFPGVLLHAPDGEYVLTWNDGSYRYELRSATLSVEQLLQLARSTAPVSAQQMRQDTVPVRIEEIRYPVVGRFGWEATVQDDSYEVYELEYTKNGEYIGRFVQTTIATALDDDIRSEQSIEYVYGDRIVYVSIDEKDTAIVVWSDGEYAYRLEIPENYVDKIPLLVTAMLSERTGT